MGQNHLFLFPFSRPSPNCPAPAWAWPSSAPLSPNYKPPAAPGPRPAPHSSAGRAPLLPSLTARQARVPAPSPLCVHRQVGPACRTRPSPLGRVLSPPWPDLHGPNRRTTELPRADQACREDHAPPLPSLHPRSLRRSAATRSPRGTESRPPSTACRAPRSGSSPCLLHFKSRPKLCRNTPQLPHLSPCSLSRLSASKSRRRRHGRVLLELSISTHTAPKATSLPLSESLPGTNPRPQHLLPDLTGVTDRLSPAPCLSVPSPSTRTSPSTPQ